MSYILVYILSLHDALPIYTLVYSALPAGGVATGPDVDAARAISERLVSAPLKHAVIVSSAAVYGPNHENAGLLDEPGVIADGRRAVADGRRQVGRRAGAERRGRGAERPAAAV